MGIITLAIKEKLSLAFNPSQLEVLDESHKHAGHAGAAQHAATLAENGGGAVESHVHVVITSDAFKAMGTLAKHRAVMEVLKDEVAQLHAFIGGKTPATGRAKPPTTDRGMVFGRT